MSATREKYPQTALADNTAVLAFQKRAKFSFPKDYYDLSWEGLHELRSKIVKANEGILEIAEKEKRDLGEEEKRAFDFGLAVLDAVQEEFDMRSAANTKNPLPEPAKFSLGTRTFSSDGQELSAYGSKGPCVKKDYRSMFKVGSDTGGFTSMDDFLNPIVNRLRDERLDKRTFLAKDGVLGGYSVPEYWAASIFDTALEGEIVRPRAIVYPMESETLHIPAWDSSNHSTDGLYGGFSIQYLGENNEGTIQTGKLRQVTLSSKKVAIYTELSREVATSSMSLETQLQGSLKKAVGFLLDRDFLVGDGVAKPLGILNSPSKITISRATANQIDYDDLIAMYGRLSPGSHSKAVWIANHSTLPQIMNLQVGGELIFAPIAQGGISGPVPMNLFGLPLLFTEKTPALGTAGDLMLVDCSQYAVGLREGLIIDISNAPGWTRDVISLRVIVRMDGVSLWKDPVTPINGGSTLSWCVVLQ